MGSALPVDSPEESPVVGGAGGWKAGWPLQGWDRAARAAKHGGVREHSRYGFVQTDRGRPIFPAHLLVARPALALASVRAGLAVPFRRKGERSGPRAVHAFLRRLHEAA